jgi:hypothetical protein
MNSNFLPIRQAITVSVKNFRSFQTGVAITNDTSMVFNIYNSALALVVGPISMAHSSLGNYFGTVTPSPALTENSRYKIIIKSTTYPVEWIRWLKAEERGFPVT